MHQDHKGSNPNVNQSIIQSINQPQVLLPFVCDGMQQYDILVPVLAGMMPELNTV